MPRSDINCAMRLATMVATLRPRPMSMSRSARWRLPLQRSNDCHSAAAAVSVGSVLGSVWPSERNAWVNMRSPMARDSSASMVFR